MPNEIWLLYVIGIVVAVVLLSNWGIWIFKRKAPSIIKNRYNKKLKTLIDKYELEHILERTSNLIEHSVDYNTQIGKETSIGENKLKQLEKSLTRLLDPDIFFYETNEPLATLTRCREMYKRRQELIVETLNELIESTTQFNVDMLQNILDAMESKHE
jgi:hypothetical protein